ncbi:cyclopropane mycolic acid synthase family methyltransferase [Rhodococcus qingshengii]|uniref:cyclopropane mycolic acid synthase family methyltransferase n=1 Tax=Rhodococcus qingshengii TaxID=334542 RepID=UPI001BE51499|nr:cyclopropane mycolic acid synthase family methyltransferase [Rhodococcus qingshengii]MBT2275868.1 class I SAM-dependent methyltransferase [Rhodococcus qingshengii]
MTKLTPFYENVQSHYDLDDEFFALFLDPSRTYSCAYFEREDMSLKDAQLAKIDLALGKCNLTPGMTLLDIGCGWGSTMTRAADKYDVDVIGLTLSENQHRYVQHMIESTPSRRRREVRLQGWEDFDGHADRIVSIGAFEHFRLERYDDFFDKCAALLPPDGRMLLHTIVGFGQRLREMGIPITREDIQFHRFILREIFPGGQIPLPDWVTGHAGAAGFTVQRIQALQPHYARTLDLWAEALRVRRTEAIALTSDEIYERYIKYLTGSADRFRSGHIDVMQFTLINERHLP